MSSPQMQQPNPALLFQTINAYQRTEALKSAIELEVFTAIGEGKTTPAVIAQRCGAAERGIRILCDFLTIMGFLTKTDQKYALSPDAAAFLDKKSPAYMGDATQFMLSPMLTAGYKDLTAAVRKGGVAASEEGTIAPDHPVWVDFARSMAPLMSMPAELMARLVDPEGKQKLKILDIAAGHGLFGIAFAKHNPNVEVVALDWANVLEVAKENAKKAGVADRYSTINGSAFEVPFGESYDIVLLTNFLHHFDPPTCETLLRKVYAAISPGGRAVTLEFVPNDDRITPPEAASFSMMMLGSTPAGDAYTFAELEKMMTAAGFGKSELHSLEPSIEQVVIAYKN